RALGEPVILVNGGYDLAAETPDFPGNFLADPGARFAVVEVDESDKSLVQFTPHYGVLLNVGNDHYSQDELRQVFTTFLGRCREGIACLSELASLADGCRVPLATFGPEPAPGVLAPLRYAASPDGIRFDAPPCGEAFHTTQSGRHSALNACAVLALLRLLQLPQAQTPQRLREAIAAFRGVRQRFEQMGSRPDGTPVINDYAHNPEKIAAALATARERFGSPLTAVFQPHGFSALRNFRPQLCESLSAALTPADTLILLPVYYAGGTATFSPTSDEVAAELRDGGVNAVALSREEATRAIAAQCRPSCVIVMGARDPSLRDWSAQLATTVPAT
ncbi:MAG: glutamate ligase domain-containing protein, partial [Oligosphaeraceae bacterium]